VPLTECTFFLCRTLCVLRIFFFLNGISYFVPAMTKHCFRWRLLIQTLVFRMKGGREVGSGYSVEVKLSCRNRTKEAVSDTTLHCPVSNSCSRQVSYSRSEISSWDGKQYRGADKSLARPGRKQAIATEDFLSFIYPVYIHNWRYINTIYVYNKTSIKRNILTIKQFEPGASGRYGKH
jgi:hypothetical protein